MSTKSDIHNTTIDLNIETLPQMPGELACDVAVIGGGPNGLMAAAYLAKTGLKVILLERRYEAGGGLATEEILFPGYYANTHATYHMMVDYMPALKDFDLSVHSLKFVKPENQTGILFKDRSSIIVSDSIKKTARQLADISKEDALSFERYANEFQKMVDEIIAPGTYHPPAPPMELIVKMNKTEIGQKVAGISEETPVEIIERLFKDDRIRALFLYTACMWGLSPNEGGLGFMVPLLITRCAMNKCICMGGSHKLGSSFAKEIVINNGLILENAEVTKITTENGRVTGLELFDGQVIKAKAVASSLDPATTFIDLVGKENLPKDLQTYAERWAFEKTSFFTTHVALKEPVSYRADNKDINTTLMNIIGIESMEDVVRQAEAAKTGEIGLVAGHSTVETLYDRTLSLPGRHTAFFQMLSPSEVNGGWESRKEEIENQILSQWRQYASNVTAENVVLTTSESPLEIERRIPCMKNGSIKHGEYNALQMGNFRPNNLCSSTGTPIEGLYVCGASTYPGGLVIGGPGYIAAGRIADDMGVARWWKQPEMLTKFIEEYMQ